MSKQTTVTKLKAELLARIAKLELLLLPTEPKILFTIEAPGYLPVMMQSYKDRIVDLFRKCQKKDTTLNRTHSIKIEGEVNSGGDSDDAACDLRFHASDGWGWADFRLQMMPGCCKMLVSYYTGVNGTTWERQGWGSLMQDIKEDIARYVGASSIVATVVKGNVAEEACLKKHGWKRVSFFDKDRLAVWQKNLTEKK